MTKSDTPALPADLAGNGQAVWDWADKMSAHTQRLHEIRTLRAQLLTTGNRCGDCSKWMKSRECPAERNVDGMSRGPSANSHKCSAFEESLRSQARRAELTLKLAGFESGAA